MTPTHAFWAHLTGPFTTPNLFCIALFGLVVGWLSDGGYRAHGIAITPFLAARLCALVLVGIIAATMFGSSWSTPSLTQQYLGNRLAYLVLSLLFSTTMCGGMYLAAVMHWSRGHFIYLLTGVNTPV